MSRGQPGLSRLCYALTDFRQELRAGTQNQVPEGARREPAAENLAAFRIETSLLQNRAASSAQHTIAEAAEAAIERYSADPSAPYDCQESGRQLERHKVLSR